MRALLVVIALLALTPSCALFQSACAETAAARASASALISEAQIALDQAESVIAVIASPSVRHDALVALDAARAALRGSAEALSGVSDVCDRFDLRSAFAAFREAWEVLAPYLKLLGGPGGTAVRAPRAAVL